MAKTSFPAAHGALRAMGWSSLAAVLALAAMPTPALSQDSDTTTWSAERTRVRSSSEGTNKEQSGPQKTPPRETQRNRIRATEEVRQTERRDFPMQKRSYKSLESARTTESKQQPPKSRITTQQQNQARFQQDREQRNRRYTDPDRDWSYGRDQQRDERRDDRHGWRDGDRNEWRDRQEARERDRRIWDRDWRNDQRYDWRSYRKTHRHVYRYNHYAPPYSHYRYRRLGIGFYLDSVFFGSRYWIADPWYYRLPPAYGPYRWVRYYDDALLVDIYTGEVVDVIHDFFW